MSVVLDDHLEGFLWKFAKSLITAALQPWMQIYLDVYTSLPAILVFCLHTHLKEVMKIITVGGAKLSTALLSKVFLGSGTKIYNLFQSCHACWRQTSVIFLCIENSVPWNDNALDAVEWNRVVCVVAKKCKSSSNNSAWKRTPCSVLALWRRTRRVFLVLHSAVEDKLH